MFAKSDKPYDRAYRYNVKIDPKLINELFTLISDMNIHDIKQFTLMNMIPLNITDENGNNMIHKVIMVDDTSKTEFQRLNMIKFLYEEHVNPDAPNNMNNTPLHLACIKQYEKIIDYLLGLDVDINYEDNFGNTPLHKIVSGKRVSENKLTPGNIIPIPKKAPFEKIDIIRDIRKEIWNNIKDSQYLQSIKQTLRQSIQTNKEDKDIILTFLNDLNKIITNTTSPTDQMNELKDLKGIALKSFRDATKNKWSNFPDITDIVIHKTEDDSFEQGNDYAIIRNGDINKLIDMNIETSINNILSLVGTELQVHDIDYNSYHEDLLKYLINLLELNEIQPPEPLWQHILNNYDMKMAYKLFHDPLKIPYCINFADNIMDLENKTFIGGCHKLLRIGYDNQVNDIYNIFRDENYLGRILYLLVYPINRAIQFNGNFNIGINPGNIYLQQNAIPYPNDDRFYDYIIEYIYMLIIDGDINTIEQRLREHILSNNYNYVFNLLTLMDNKSEFRMNWLYNFIITYLSDEYLRRVTALINPIPMNNLNYIIRLLLLISLGGIINKKNDLKKSIMNSFKITLWTELLYNTNNNRRGFSQNTINQRLMNASTITAWVLCLLYESDNTIRDLIDIFNNNVYADTKDAIIIKINYLAISDELKAILVNCIDILSTDFLQNEINTHSNRLEQLCNRITVYYNNMTEPCMAIHLADVLVLLRKTIMYDPDFIRYYYLDNLVPIYNTSNPNFIDQQEIYYRKLMRLYDSQYIDKFINVIGDKKNGFNIWLITEHLLPSSVNFFIHNNYGDLNVAELQFDITKYIESYYLGLNYMGLIWKYKNVNSINDYPNIPVYLNLFYFDISGVPERVGPLAPYNGYNGGTDIEIFYTNGDEEYFRPANKISLINIYYHFLANINKHINIINKRLYDIFNKIKTNKDVKLYATSIRYLYPSLLSLTNHFNYVKRMSDGFMGTLNSKSQGTKNIFDSIKEIFDIVEFNLSSLQNGINNMNGYMFMKYYINSQTQIKIPKFLYHKLGNNPLVVFDDISVNKYEIEKINTVLVEEETSLYPLKTTNSTKPIGFFDIIIDNDNYLDIHYFERSFITSKDKPLPPSLEMLLNEFYRFNTINVIKENINNIISKVDIDSKLDQIINQQLSSKLDPNMIIIQKKFILAKIIQEVIQFNLRNEIVTVGNELFEQIITNKKTNISDINILFEKVDFESVLAKPLSIDLLKSITDFSIYKYTGSVVKSKDYGKQFYIYPDNYYRTNLLLNKLKLVITDNCINKLLDKGAKIFKHNNENQSALNYLVKDGYYNGIKIFKDYGITKDSFTTNSPYDYLMTQYMNHKEQYNDKFYDTQYRDIESIIQQNDMYYNNILKYLDTSFGVVKYITEEYITELLLGYDKFDDLRITISYDSVKYNDMLDTGINIASNDMYFYINEQITEYNKEVAKLNKDLEHYKTIHGKNNSSTIASKITTLTTMKTDYTNEKNRLKAETTKLTRASKIILFQTDLITRYNTLAEQLQRIWYMDGWKQLLDKKIPSYPIQLLGRTPEDNNDIYKYWNDIFEKYFTTKYVDDDDTRKFTYDLLIHLTKYFLFPNILGMYKRVLFDSLRSISTDYNILYRKIDNILLNEELTNFMDNIIPKLFVNNAVGLFENIHDESEKTDQTVSEILGNFIDLMRETSEIEITRYTIDILKSNVNQYFDSIVYKIINNWNVVIENILIFHINQYRMTQSIVYMN